MKAPSLYINTVPVARASVKKKIKKIMVLTSNFLTIIHHSVNEVATFQTKQDNG